MSALDLMLRAAARLGWVVVYTPTATGARLVSRPDPRGGVK